MKNKWANAIIILLVLTAVLVYVYDIKSILFRAILLIMTVLYIKYHYPNKVDLKHKYESVIWISTYPIMIYFRYTYMGDQNDISDWILFLNMLFLIFCIQYIVFQYIDKKYIKKSK